MVNVRPAKNAPTAKKSQIYFIEKRLSDNQSNQALKQLVKRFACVSHGPEMEHQQDSDARLPAFGAIVDGS